MQEPLLNENERNANQWKYFLGEALIDLSNLHKYVSILKKIPFQDRKKLTPEKLAKLGISKPADQFNILFHQSKTRGK